MKVTRNTRDQLIVANVPWLLSLGLIGFTLIFLAIGMSVVMSGQLMGFMFIVIGGGVGLFMLAVMARRTQVIFDRSTGTVTMRSRSVTGYTQTHRALDHLVRAEMQTTRGKNGDMHRPALVFARRGAETAEPLIALYTNFGNTGRIVAEINAWLDAGEVDSGAGTS